MTVYATLAAQVFATAALVVFEQARGRQLAREISALGGDPHAPGAQAVVGAVTLFAILIMFVAATTIAVVVACMIWLIRARRDTGQARPAAPSVLAGWFVPGVNLIAPPVMMDRLWWASRPPVNRRTRWLTLLTAWWLSWLAALTLVLVRLSSGTSKGSTALTGLGPVELAAVTIAALLCAATVRQISRIQAVGAQRRRRIAEGGGVARPFPQIAAELTPHTGAGPASHTAPFLSAEPPSRVAPAITGEQAPQAVPQTAPN
ncbi:DUF4328 domain-containing protein [Streptosporangium lutulentum]|uniref:Heme/copper-type cytochrome/quinol oxidase subunit 2 n=1 Tax=Streptosporangium lutulentum TaxID=1461250 RepID=A0ABT9QTJ0_9ACTN|nr:DUF4328 domain-containing protein [Streptosporangium lutulentum]MDP9850082.1 heme/copper-type cytochrome/quinol oxidase subunit 2 [Streptosporangium lutulentum]